LKIAFSLKKTPPPGRFFYEVIISLSLVLLFASWMTSVHFLPWNNWHNEAPAFASVLLLSGVLVKHHFDIGRRTILLPMFGWPIGLLCAVVAIQVATRQIAFTGDAVVLTFYLLLCLLALTLGYAVISPNENGTASAAQLVDKFAVLVVVGGVFSAIVALVQALDIWEFGGWITRLQSLRRPGGNLAQPNHLATLLLFSIASAAYLFESRRLSILVAPPITAVLLCGLAVTESRGGVVGLFLMAAWWLVKQRRLGFALSRSAVVSWLVFFGGCFWFWPTLFNVILEGGWNESSAMHFNTSTSGRLEIWPQLWQTVLLRPWFGWGLREVSTAQNAVADAYAGGGPVAYAHNIVLDLAVGIGLPLTLLLVGAALVWLWRRANAANDLLTWYCIAVVLPFGVHSMVEYPFAYAYLLAPVMLLIGVLEARLAPGWAVRIPWWTAATAWVLICAAMVWSMVEYIAIEEDFRIVRFEAMHVGHTPGDYQRPHIVMLTQLDALLHGGRIVPKPGMSADELDLARKVALRFPWPATQNRYAQSLALNGNPGEAIRQLRVMRAMHGEKAYAQIKAGWVALADDKYPQLRALTLP
jgi:O-antigen ligase